MNVGQLVARSLRIIGVGDPAEAPQPEDYATAIQALNSMARRWEALGLIPGWTDASNPATDLTLPAAADDALVYGLAMRLRPEYGRALDPEVTAYAQQSVMALWRDRIAPNGLARTVGSIVLRSLRMLVQAGTNPDNFNLEGALIALNAMMQRWEANGLALGWSAAPDIDEPLPTPPEADEPMAANLAMRLQPEYGAQLSPAVIAIADGGLAALRRDVKVASPLCYSDRRGGYDTRTDSYDL